MPEMLKVCKDPKSYPKILHKIEHYLVVAASSCWNGALHIGCCMLLLAGAISTPQTAPSPSPLCSGVPTHSLGSPWFTSSGFFPVAAQG